MANEDINIKVGEKGGSGLGGGFNSALNIYARCLKRVAMWIITPIWGFLSPIILGLPGFIAIGIVFFLLIIDNILKGIIMLFRKGGFILNIAADIMAGVLEGMAVAAKVSCMLAMKGLGAIGAGISTYVLSYGQGDGNIAGQQPEISQTYNSVYQEMVSGGVYDYNITPTPNSMQAFKINRRETLQSYENTAEMLEYAYRFGDYWMEALTLGILRQEYLERDYQIKKELGTTEGIFSTEQNAGQIKYYYYWRYIEALEKAEKTGDKKDLYDVYMEDSLLNTIAEDKAKEQAIKDENAKIEARNARIRQRNAQIKEGSTQQKEEEEPLLQEKSFYDAQIRYIMDLFYDDTEGVKDELESVQEEMIYSKYTSLRETFNKFVGYQKVFENNSAEEYINGVIPMVYGGYEYPKAYYSPEDETAVMGIQIYAYQETSIIAPEDVFISEIGLMEEDIEGGREGLVAYIDLQSTDMLRKYRLVGIDKFSKVFQLKVGTIAGDERVVTGGMESITEWITNYNVYTYDTSDEVIRTGGKIKKYVGSIINKITLSEGTVIGTFAVSDQSVDTQESDIEGQDIDYFLAELYDNGQNSVIETKVGFVIPSEYKGRYRFATTEAETQNITGSRLYGDGIRAENDGYIKEIGWSQETGKTMVVDYGVKGIKTYKNLREYGETAEKLLTDIDPYWDTKYYTFESMYIADTAKDLRKICNKYGISEENLDLFELILSMSTPQLRKNFGVELLKEDIIGTKYGNTGEQNIKAEQSCTIIGAGRDSNDLWTVEVQGVFNGEVKEYVGLTSVSDEIIKKLDDCYGENNSNYKYESWNTQYYKIDKKDEINAIKSGDTLAFRGREFDENGVLNAVNNVPIIAPEKCIVTKAGWDNSEGWSVELTSLDYERKYTFANLDSFGNEITSLLETKIGSTWKTSGEYYTFDDYIIIEEGKRIGIMGNSGGTSVGEIPLVANETLKIVNIGYKSKYEFVYNENTYQYEWKETPVYCMKLQSLDGSREYEIEDIADFTHARTALQGDNSASIIYLGKAYKEIEYNKSKALEGFEIAGSIGIRYVYPEDSEYKVVNNKEDVEKYEFNALYIYKGETIGYAKMNMTSKYEQAGATTTNEMTTKISAYSHSDKAKEGALALNRLARESDLLGAEHVNISIQKFDTLLTSSFSQEDLKQYQNNVINLTQSLEEAETQEKEKTEAEKEMEEEIKKQLSGKT